MQFTDLALQFLEPILLGACQPTASPSVTFGLLTPDTQTVGLTAELRRNCLVSCCVAGVSGAVLSQRPNPAFAKLGRIGGGESLLGHKVHPLSDLLSGKPRAVQRRRCLASENSMSPRARRACPALGLFRQQSGPYPQPHRGIQHRSVQDARGRTGEEMHQRGNLCRPDQPAFGQARQKCRQGLG